jgi:uncharacterized phage-associated protein
LKSSWCTLKDLKDAIGDGCQTANEQHLESTVKVSGIQQNEPIPATVGLTTILSVVGLGSGLMSMVSAHEVAAELRRRLPGLGIKKQHKLLYYCQGHHLAVYDELLFPETISAWDMGPVVGALWYEERTGAPASGSVELPEKALNTIGYVVSRYGALNGTDLEHLTHSESPWADANRVRLPGGRVTISPVAIAAYFRANASADEDEENTPMPDDETIANWLAESKQVRPYQGRPGNPAELVERLSGLVF